MCFLIDCIGFFSVAVIKILGRREVEGERTHFSLRFYKKKAHNGKEDVLTAGESREAS